MGRDGMEGRARKGKEMEGRGEEREIERGVGKKWREGEGKG